MLNLTNYVKSELEAVIEDALRERSIDTHISSLLASQNIKNVYCFGGFLRDTLSKYYGYEEEFNGHDVDLVVDGHLDPKIMRELIPGRYEKTVLGGYRVFPNQDKTFYLDIWSIHESYVVKELLFHPIIENIALGAVFNVNRLLFDLLNLNLMDFGALAGIQTRELRYMPVVEYLKPIQAVRALLIQKRHQYIFHQSVIDLIHSVNFTKNRTIVVEYLEGNYYSTEDIDWIVKKLKF